LHLQFNLIKTLSFLSFKKIIQKKILPFSQKFAINFSIISTYNLTENQCFSKCYSKEFNYLK